jgi:hypothetical protein
MERVLEGLAVVCFEFLAEVTVNDTGIFCEVTIYSLMCRRNILPPSSGSESKASKEAGHSSETFFNFYRTTRLHIPVCIIY